MQKRKVIGVSPLTETHEKEKPPMMGGIQLQASIGVRRSPEICYKYWHNFANLPHFMKHLQSVAMLENGRSHWMVDGPGDTTVEWDAELIEDHPNERISWRSLKNAQIDNAGSVRFVPLKGGQQTRVEVALTYNPILGPIGEFISRLFGETADQELADDLSRFKEVIEKED